MTFFEQELQKLFGHSELFTDTRFVGNACYGRLTDNIRVKINFQTGMAADNYDRLKVTLLNRNEGPIDSMVIRFKDLWGMNPTANSNFREGVIPHIWNDYGEAGWYVYKPTRTDYQQLSEAVSSYLGVFQEAVQTQQMGQTQTM